MMETEYLTVKEFAEKAGISRQAVYKKLNKSLQPFQRVLNGKIVLHINALSLFGCKPELSRVEQPIDNHSTEVVNALQAQIESLKEQIKVKDGQISDLSEMNRNAQILLLNQQKLLLPAGAAEAAADLADEPDQRPKKKLSLWDRIFK